MRVIGVVEQMVQQASPTNGLLLFIIRAVLQRVRMSKVRPAVAGNAQEPQVPGIEPGQSRVPAARAR